MLILIVGVFLVFSLSVRDGRERREAMERVAVGDPGARAIEVLGVQPLRCGASELEHLRTSFPEGWTTAATDLAIERLAAVTAERWVFSTDETPATICASTGPATEVGVDSVGSIVWFVAVLGDSPLRLPPWLQPAGPVEPDSDSVPAGGN